MKRYTYYITGEEWRKVNTLNYLLATLFLMIDVSLVVFYFVGRVFFELSTMFATVFTGFNWILIIVFILLRQSSEPFRGRRMHRHDITIDGDKLHYVLANDREKIESDFTIYKTVENGYGIKYYKSRFCYVFVPRRVIEGYDLMGYKFEFDNID